MKTKSAPLSSILVGTCLLTLVSCGGSDGGGSSKSSSTRQEVEQQDDQGIYRAVFKPLNYEIAGNTSGTIEIRVEGDDFSVQSNITGAPAGVKHLQHIMLGNNCPDLSADANGDSVIDVKEAMTKTGEVLIPLDSKLSEQLAGIDYGPIANGAGNFVYKRSASLTEMLADLRAPDPDKFDSMVKLPFGDLLNLSGKVVLIHGVKSSESLAESVGTMRGLSQSQALPIACGKLVRVGSEDPTPEVEPQTTEDETEPTAENETSVEENPSASTEPTETI